MEQNISLDSLLIVVLVSFLIPIVLHRLNIKVIPIVVAEILAGLIIGKSGFNLIQDDPWLGLLSLLGLIYLMFLSGLEIDFEILTSKQKKNRGPNVLLISSIIFGFIFIVSYGLSFLFVMANFTSEVFLMTLIISTISLGVVVPVMKERKMEKTILGQIILLITVLADFITMLLLAVYITLQSENKAQSLLLILLFVVFFITYWLIRKYLNMRTISPKLLKGTAQLGTRGVFTLILLFVVLAENLGTENILGAFLAGLIISLISPGKRFQHQLESFGYGFLIPIFFVMVGVQLDVWSLFKDPSVFLLIPLLLISLFLSKIIPSLLLLKWFNIKETIAVGSLLTSTLSLLIAAVTISLELGLIDEQMYSAFILVAILASFIAPVIFNRLFVTPEKKKTKVALVGANTITLPISIDLSRDGFEVALIGEKQDKMEAMEQSDFKCTLTEVPSIEKSSLEEKGIFDYDILVFATGNDERNVELAAYAKELGAENVIVRAENPSVTDRLKELNVTHFSALFSAHTLLRALIEHPGAVRLFTQKDDSIQEIVMRNPRYDQVTLRRLPYLGDVLILRIFRNEESIIPHGDTHLQLSDRLLISGSAENIEKMKRIFE